MLFEKATRAKLRFQTQKGLCTVEDLWDITPEILDGMYQELTAEQESTRGRSLLKKTRGATKLELQIQVVEHVVKTKLDEAEERENSALKKQQKARILQIIADKEDAALLEKSPDELKEMAEAL